MRFTVDPELELFAESVRGALAGWEAPLEPVFGDVAGRSRRRTRRAPRRGRLGRALGAIPTSSARRSPAGSSSDAPSRPCASSTRRRSARRSRSAAGCGTAMGASRAVSGSRRSTARARLRGVAAAPLPSDPARLHAWGAVTLAYLAGLADGALDEAVEHARAREQFGAPLAALPAVQARLADAALARDGLLLSPWAAADPGRRLPGDALAWAGGACREVTAHVQQVHGGDRLRARGRHPPLLPAREDGAGVDRRVCCRELGLSPRRTAGERSSHIRPKGHLVGGRAAGSSLGGHACSPPPRRPRPARARAISSAT